ncbi:MAG: hypothetical protein LBL28_04240 [Treponema sp.]|jgi:hypothetical protein|nr:hypothetical protein [Treponema sp.]
MADDMNPYQSPQNPVNPAADVSGRLTETMERYLKGASPWLRFIGIVGFISVGFMGLAGIIFLIALPLIGNIWGDIPGLEEYSGTAGSIVGITMGVYLFIIAALCFFPALFTYKFGDKIRAYLQSRTEGELETAFKNNKSLWKFSGILTIIGLAFIPVTIIITIVVGIAAALS